MQVENSVRRVGLSADANFSCQFSPPSAALFERYPQITLEAFDSGDMGRQLKRLEMLTAEIKAVEKQMEESTTDDKAVQKLMTLSGIGMVTAVTLRAEIGRFDRFRTGKQLARYCSLTPRNASSGHRQADAGLIKAGNPELRRVLIQAAHRLRCRDEYWHNFSERMKEPGKPGSLIATAVANRWLRGLYHEMVAIAA